MSSLEQQLTGYAQAAATRMPPQRVHTLERAISELRAAQAGRRAPQRGQRAPDFELPDAQGRRLRLRDALADGAVVLVFYRGGWCPYCNLTLRAWAQALPALREAGASLIAVSPESPTQVSNTVQKNLLDFALLSDAGNRVAAAYGLVHELDTELEAQYRAGGVDLRRINDDSIARLPLPATFVIEPLGSVVLAQVECDYRQRLEPAAALAALPRPR